MIVSCPKCETTFAMPDELYRPGRKARCSHCANVFALPDFTVQEPASPAEPAVPLPPPAAAPKKTRSRKTTFILYAVLLICLSGIAGGGFYIYRYLTTPVDDWNIPPEKRASLLSPEEQKALEDYEKRVSGIRLESVMQRVFKNESMGNIVVIEGVAVNTFKTPRSLIAVQARLLDADRNVLAVKEQVCGNSVTRLQLETLKWSELEEVLTNQLNILLANVDVKPGGRVPCVLFFSPMPEKFADYEVRVINADEKRPAITDAPEAGGRRPALGNPNAPAAP